MFDQELAQLHAANMRRCITCATTFGWLRCLGISVANCVRFGLISGDYLGEIFFVPAIPYVRLRTSVGLTPLSSR